MPDFQRSFSGAPWEADVGYCRSLRAGDRVFVTGTAPLAEGGGVHAVGDGYQQAPRCLDIIAEALAAHGADLSHVVRTRMFVTDIDLWKDYGRAHKEVFRDHPPTYDHDGRGESADRSGHADRDRGRRDRHLVDSSGANPWKRSSGPSTVS